MQIERPAASGSPSSEFWRGLTTPSAAVLGLAAGFLGMLMVILSLLAVDFRRRHDRGEISLEGVTQDICRASIIASRGEERETDDASVALVFIGPSALRCWLPHPDEAGKLASEMAGRRVKVVSMCADQQSLAVTAALTERFGADFDGWFVFGVNRDYLGRTYGEKLEEGYRTSMTSLGFDSDLLRSEAEALGLPEVRPMGWELWERRNFHYHCRLGLEIPFDEERVYQPFKVRREMDIQSIGSRLKPADPGSFARHLAALERIAERISKTGRARMALVETPWLDEYEESMRPEAVDRSEEWYRERMKEWSAKTGIPWLSDANEFPASEKDFSDPRHVSEPKLRTAFLKVVTTKLLQP